MNLRELSSLVKRNSFPEMEIHSVDPNIYLIYSRSANQLTPLRDSAGNRLKFRSRSAAANCLRETGIRVVDFVHRSAFEEMIGFEQGSQPTEHRETIKLNLPEKSDAS